MSKNAYTITFTLDAEAPTRTQLKYYLDYWLADNGEFVEKLQVKIRPVREKGPK